MSEQRSGVGRWLAWLAYLLIAAGLFHLVSYAGYAMLNHDNMGSDGALKLLRLMGPPIGAAASLIIAGFTLLFWRRPAGLYLAFTLIWLAPVIWACYSLLIELPGVGIAAALTDFLFIILRSGALAAAGYSAFLLSVPGIQEAYGLIAAGGATTDSASNDRQAQQSGGWDGWLTVLCAFLLLPLLSLVPAFGAAMSSSWTGTEMARQAICLIIILPMSVTVIVLFKYRHPRSILVAIAVLWAMPVIQLLGAVAHSVGAAASWGYVGRLPHHFGFDIGTALAWTAYLLNAPRIQALYQMRSSSDGRLRYE